MPAYSKTPVRFEVSRVTHDETYAMSSPHSHSYYEIFFLTRGRCTLIVNNRKHLLEPGDIALISPDTPHLTSYTLGYLSERICLEFSENYLKGIFDSLGKTRFEEEMCFPFRTARSTEFTDICRSFDMLLERRDSKNPYASLLLGTTLQQLLYLIFSCEKTPSAFETISKNFNSNIEKALEFINLHYDRKTSISEIAGILHLNPTYFSKLFKDETGQNFSRHLRNLRIVHAETLLLETKKTITEIAYSCGFSNSNYFCEAFRKVRNISPTEFRRIKGNLI